MTSAAKAPKIFDPFVFNQDFRENYEIWDTDVIFGTFFKIDGASFGELPLAQCFGRFGGIEEGKGENPHPFLQFLKWSPCTSSRRDTVG